MQLLSTRQGLRFQGDALRASPLFCSCRRLCLHVLYKWGGDGCDVVANDVQIVTHMMPDLPNMGFERDLEGFREFFENPAFRPDGLKLYPTLVSGLRLVTPHVRRCPPVQSCFLSRLVPGSCLARAFMQVIRGTGLYELWKTGAYRNYPPDQLVDLCARLLALVPPWTRVYRIQRDIPMPLVSSGATHASRRCCHTAAAFSGLVLSLVVVVVVVAGVSVVVVFPRWSVTLTLTTPRRRC